MIYHFPAEAGADRRCRERVGHVRPGSQQDDLYRQCAIWRRHRGTQLSTNAIAARDGVLDSGGVHSGIGSGVGDVKGVVSWFQEGGEVLRLAWNCPIG